MLASRFTVESNWPRKSWQDELSLNLAAAEFKLSRQTRREMGAPLSPRWDRAALADRSSRPQRSPRSTSPELAARVETLRRQRWTGVRIAQTTDLSRATVSRILRRLHLNTARLSGTANSHHPLRTSPPGDLLHIDIKKFARIAKPGHRITGNPQDETRGAGWEFLYVAVDDHSRIAFTAMLPDETASSSSQFLRQAVAYFARFGIVPCAAS